MMRWSTAGWVVATAGLAACISSTPPGPVVRYFDPLPAVSANATGDAASVVAGFAWRVSAAPHLGREYVVRTGPRELVFDPLHSWIATPRELVEAALASRSGMVGPQSKVAELRITAFEVDLTETPRAHVHFELVVPGMPRREVDASAPALGGGPEAVASAMAVALAVAVNEVGTLR
jgi:hypothetical protein